MICFVCIVEARRDGRLIEPINAAVTVRNGTALCAEHMIPSVHQHIREN